MSGSKSRAVWSPEARADLSDIWTYYARHANQLTADSIILSIGAAVDVINDHPHAGRSRDDVRPGLRSASASPYIIFYRIGPRELPEIIRVLAERRDIDPLFVVRQ
jgi:plasmid stabilization system protein ParE